MEWESDSPCCSHTYPRQAHRVWGLWGHTRARAAIDCGEADQEEVREETAVGSACGGKLCSMEARRYCWVTGSGWSHHRSLSLSPQATISSWTRGWPIKRLMHWTPSRTPGGPLCAWLAEQQIRTPGKGARYVPEQLELQKKTEERSLLITSSKRLEERLR